MACGGFCLQEVFTGYMKRARIAIIVLAVVLAAGAAAYFIWGNREYTNYEVVRELESSEVPNYTIVDGSLVRYGSEGAQAVSKDGTLLWNVTYDTMKNPVFSFCGTMAVAADIGTKQYLLTNGTGSSKSFSTPYQIQAICVAKQGVTAVLMNAEEKDYIYLYSKEGEVLSEIETIVARDGFPLAIALSEDGMKLVTSYMKVEGDESVSSVTFYNFGEVGQNYARNLVGQVQYAGCLVPRLSFWDNNTVAVVGGNVAELFSMKEIPASVWKKEISTEIKSIAFGDYFCMITENKDRQNVLEVYNKSGQLCMEKIITFSYVGLQTAGKEVILYGYSGCEMYEIGSGLFYTGTFEGGVRYLFAIGGNRYYLVGSKSVRVIKLI